MSRSLSATLSSAITQTATRPIYLIEMAFETTSRVATWDSAVTWGGYSWSASGIEVSNLSESGGRMTMPSGSSDPWLALVLNDGTRGRGINIYQHHYDQTASPQADAVLIFSGLMDKATITDRISVSLIESSTAKAFPALSADESTFTRLLTSGDVIEWGGNVITVN